MNHNQIFTLIRVLLSALLLAACATPTAAPAANADQQSCPTAAAQTCPTAAAQTCPTAEPLSCPTAAALEPAVMNSWRWTVAGEANAVITFEKGDKCSMTVVKPLTEPGINLSIVVNDTTYNNYMVVGLILDPGKTLADVDKWNNSNSAPPFAQSIGLAIVNPASRTDIQQSINIPGQLYYTCFVQGPGALRAIANVGLVTVPAAAAP